MSNSDRYPVDFTIDKIFKSVQEEVKKLHGIDLDIETIKRVVAGQSISTIEGFKHGHTVSWKYFGSFVATPERIKKLNETYAKKNLTPTLVDNGFMRLSFKKNGTVQD